MYSLLSLVAGATITVHSDLPPELTTALARSITHQTRIVPEITRHDGCEDTSTPAEHLRRVRSASRTDVVLIVHFDRRTERVEASLIDRPGHVTRTFSVELARGALPRLISLDALARAAFPAAERPLASMLDLTATPVPKSRSTAPQKSVAPGAYELTVEVDQREVGR